MAFTATWRALQPVRRWGWPGTAGLACLAVAGAAAALWLPALRHEADALARAADVAERRAERAGSQRLAQVRGVPAPQRFRDGFPPATMRQERLSALLSVAAEHGLEPQRSEFRVSQERELGLDLYTLTLPLVGRYPQLRAFIEDAQLRDPALSLDRMRMRRASATMTSIETDLTWTFYMQSLHAPAVGGNNARGDAR